MDGRPMIEPFGRTGNSQFVTFRPCHRHGRGISSGEWRGGVRARRTGANGRWRGACRRGRTWGGVPGWSFRSSWAWTPWGVRRASIAPLVHYVGRSAEFFNGRRQGSGRGQSHHSDPGGPAGDQAGSAGSRSGSCSTGSGDVPRWGCGGPWSGSMGMSGSRCMATLPRAVRPGIFPVM